MTTYEDQAIEFLAGKENIAEALEVERLMPNVKRMLKARFWKGLVHDLQRRLESSPVHGWKVSRDDEDDKKVGSVRIEPIGMHGPYYSPAIEVDKERLSYGLWYRHEQGEKPQPNLAEVMRLREDIAKPKEPAGGGVNEEWWLAWWWTDASYGDDKFYFQMVEAPDRLINEHADFLWELFYGHREAIEQINRQIASQVQ